MSTPSEPTRAPRASRAEGLTRLLEVARRAPSGDNCQPWRFRFEGEAIQVFFVPERAEALMDVRGLASRMALGALLENAALAGPGLGLRVTWALEPEAGDPLHWARIDVSPGAGQSELAPFIAERHTNRAGFLPEPLAPGLVEVLADEADAPVGVQVITDREAITRLAGLVAVSDRVRAETRRCHEDLYRWFRWTAAEAEATRDGLDLRTFPLPGLLKTAQRLIRPWAVARVANRLGGARAASHFGRDQVLASGAVGAVLVPDLGAATAVQAGRVYQRIWLRAAQQGLGFCPIGTLPLLLLHSELEGETDITGAYRARLEGLRAPLQEVLGLTPAQRPLLMFRVGQAAPAAVRSLRRPLEELLS